MQSDDTVVTGTYGDGEYITPKALARKLGITNAALHQMRKRGEGPPYLKGKRFVRYKIADVKAWLNANTILKQA